MMAVNVDANLVAPALRRRAARAVAPLWPGRGERVQERARTGPGRRGLLGVEGGTDPARPGGRARMGRAGRAGQHRPPQRGVRHGHLGRRDHRRSSFELPAHVEAYKTNNLLGVEITSTDVARLIVALCSPAFMKTTGAQIPIDGGTDRTI